MNTLQQITKNCFADPKNNKHNININGPSPFLDQSRAANNK